MRRFLIVALGGSGGAAATYAMDQLRSELATFGIDSIPKGWQFVHIDVPVAPEAGPDGLGTVAQQGGTYLGCGPANNAYPVLDNALTHRFSEKRELAHIGSWAPRDPEQVTVPISAGAGQYRALGRLITLSRAAEIRGVLERAADELYSLETINEMKGLRIPGLGDYDDSPPITLVISSMAGGSGASMALDVCRLMTLVPRLSPELTGVFMVAPNVFDALPESARTGVRPNALAMLGEIVAAQAGAAYPHDVQTLATVGHQQGATRALPFARVFPVGRYVGVERNLFGDGTPKAVYRGLGRGLAGLIMSAYATEQFEKYDLGNEVSSPGDRSVLGWGVEWRHLPWGSYGYASLSTGRDRYAEYAAQRIARSCVEQLLHGHEADGSSRSSVEQVAGRVEAIWPTVCAALRLPLATDPGSDVERWMTTTALPRDEAEGMARIAVARDVAPAVPDPTGLRGREWVPTVRQQLAARRDDLTREVTAKATEWAFHWQHALAGLVERQVAEVVADNGLPTAVALVEQLTGHVRDVLLPGVERLSSFTPPDIAAIPPALQPTLDGLTGVINNGREIKDQLQHAYFEQVRTHVYAHATDLVRQILAGLVVDVLTPLGRALAEAQRLLERAMAQPPMDIGLARLATDQCAAWPTDDDGVPARFDHADNEVLLTSSADFDEQYRSDLLRSVPATGQGLADARGRVVAQVVRGVWATAGGVRPPDDLLDRRQSWRSRAFAEDPRTREPLIPRSARYDLTLRPAQLLERARMFVARDGESFASFSRLSLRDYVRGDGASESELADRQQTIVAKFTEALALARPLIGVDATVLQKVHGRQIEFRYKFSEVPLIGLPIAEQLERVLTAGTTIDPSSVTNLRDSLGQNAVTKIDIFGSYPNYSPLVFDAVLAPAAEQWARTGEIGRESFWLWRRSRPLDASMPMGDAERRAMVKGWFLAQIVGHLRTPAEPYTDPVQIWDREAGSWLAFPDPLLTPPSRFRAAYDWLPAVLESILIAMARSPEAPVMASLRPYQLLRATYDGTSQDPVSGINVLSSRRLLAGWLTTGETPDGGSSRVAEAAAATGIDERAKAATAWATKLKEFTAASFLPSTNGTPSGPYAAIAERRHAARAPLFRDLAPDVHAALAEIVDLVEEGRQLALRPSDTEPPSPPPTGPPRLPDDPEIPKDPGF